METAFNEVMKAQLHYNNCLRNVEAKEEEVNISYKRLQEVKQRVYNCTCNIEIASNLESFQGQKKISIFIKIYFQNWKKNI